ncbi:MAG: ABC transporter substrate-binding protein [Firmicutes bacterium]|nr:ABC transporter substrate-binding protein [Bacillota bacterium]
MRKLTRISVILLAFVLLLSACASAQDRALNLSILAALTTLNPLDSNNLQDTMFLQQMNDGLFHVNEVTREVEPRLAESWEVSEDGMSITFKIRSGAKFHNGDTVKASDAVYSFEFAMNSPRIKTYYSAIESVEAPDDSTFIVHLKAPNATFFSTLSNHNYVVSQREMEEQGEAFGTKMHAGSAGPYKLTRLDGLDSYWEVEAFEDYWDGPPAIKKVTYKPITQSSAGLIAFESGELDWYIAPIANWAALEANRNINSELVTANHQTYVILNHNNAELQDDNLRKAIAYAIDKDACNIIAYDGYAEIADYMYNPNLNIAAPTHDVVYSYNPELAKEYLAKSSMPNGGKLSGAIQCSAGGYFERLAVVIQQNLADIGLHIEVTPMQSATNMDIMRANNHFMGVSGGTCTGDYDGIRIWYHSESAGTSFAKLNTGGKFDYKWIDEMLEAGAANSDVEEREKIYAELDAYVMEGAVYLPIFHRPQPYVWSKDLNIPVNYPNYPRVYEWSWK